MNIFVLNYDTVTSARDHCDRHCVKMIVEYCQLLSTAHRIHDGKKIPVGKKMFYVLEGEYLHIFGNKAEILNRECYMLTHANHPCAVWARATRDNYLWLVDLLDNLLAEYTSRYGRIHASSALMPFLRNPPKNIPLGKLTPFAQCMPDQYRQSDPVEAYRAFYLGEKMEFAAWNHSPIPDWIGFTA